MSPKVPKMEDFFDPQDQELANSLSYLPCIAGTAQHQAQNASSSSISNPQYGSAILNADLTNLPQTNAIAEPTYAGTGTANLGIGNLGNSPLFAIGGNSNDQEGGSSSSTQNPQTVRESASSVVPVTGFNTVPTARNHNQGGGLQQGVWKEASVPSSGGGRRRSEQEINAIAQNVLSSNTGGGSESSNANLNAIPSANLPGGNQSPGTTSANGSSTHPELTIVTNPAIVNGHLTIPSTSPKYGLTNPDASWEELLQSNITIALQALYACEANLTQGQIQKLNQENKEEREQAELQERLISAMKKEQDLKKEIAAIRTELSELQGDSDMTDFKVRTTGELRRLITGFERDMGLVQSVLEERAL